MFLIDFVAPPSTRYPLPVTRCSLLDTRDKLENTLEVFISFRRCVHNFQMAKFESWQAAIERLIANYKLALHCPGQSSPVQSQFSARQIQLNFGFTLSIKHTKRWPAAVKACTANLLAVQAVASM